MRGHQYKVLKIVTYTMYLITVTDIENPEFEIHRLVFDLSLIHISEPTRPY